MVQKSRIEIKIPTSIKKDMLKQSANVGMTMTSYILHLHQIGKELIHARNSLD